VTRLTDQEATALRVLEEAVRWVVVADRAAEEAGYGSETRSSLSQALEALSYALNVAKGLS
jgi:hypothetical protein